MQQVDPFIPIKRQPVLRPKPVQPPRRPVGVMDVAGPRIAPRPSQHQAAPVPKPETLAAPAVPAGKTAKRFRFWGKLRSVGFVAAVLLAGTAAQTLVVGETLVAAYGVYALARRTPSRTTFALALVALAATAALRVVGKDQLLAGNFAVYAFLLTAVGIVCLARETRRA